MPDEDDWAPSTRQIHAGYTAGVAQNPAVVPIYQSSAYVFESFQAAADIFALRTPGNLYSRTGNPTNAALEKRVASLDGGVAALATGSGQSAVAIALLALVRGGHHIVAAHQLYGGSVDLLEDTFNDFGIEVTFVDARTPSAWADAVRPETRAFFLESIGNPLATVPDLSAIAEIAHAHDIPFVVDNTMATPHLLRPIDFGADIVVHSATKFLGGHGNSLAGVIVDAGRFDFGAKPERWSQFTAPSRRFGLTFWEAFGAERSAYLAYAKAKLSHDLGPALSPFNSFLILQGIETLDIRMRKHTDSALTVARFLHEHPAVSVVHHPQIEGHPDAEQARTYLPRGVGSVFSFNLAAPVEAVGPFIDSLRLFELVANVGDVRSLVVHPATTTHSRFTPEQRERAGISLTTIRLSIGLEDPVDLIGDLRQALDSLTARTSETTGTSSATGTEAIA